MPFILKSEWVRLKRPGKKVHHADTLRLDTGKVIRVSDCGITIDDTFEVVDPEGLNESDYCKTCEATFVGRQ
jgi:hypothetical protein